MVPGMLTFIVHLFRSSKWPRMTQKGRVAVREKSATKNSPCGENFSLQYMS